MTKSLKLYIAGVVAASAGALLITTLLFPPQPGIAISAFSTGPLTGSDTWLGILFWTGATLFASANPVKMPRGSVVSVALAPIVASMVLGGPAVAGWVALIGTTEVREIRGRIPWYGSLANHAGALLPAIAGGIVTTFLMSWGTGLLWSFCATLVGAAVLIAVNVVIASLVVSLRSGQSLRVVVFGDARGFWTNFFALAPLAWLMTQVYRLPGGVGWWATLIFALPLYTTRVSHRQFADMREMFTQTIASLAQAVDKRDKFTSGHSLRVKDISVDIGKVMRCSDSELEALEWGGLLHDVGKIGVPDAVLLKQERLTREERTIMNAHPVLGAEIISPVTKLRPELPIIRHHHEWYNGSGYPDRLMGDEIPFLARILHVADAFEAMTAARPYRMRPLTAEQALAELRKFAGIQFDPTVVDAFVRTRWVEGSADPGRDIKARPVPLIAQAATRMAQASSLSETGGATHDLG